MVQSVIVLLIVAAAALYLGVRVRSAVLAGRRARGEPGCGDACGCGTGERAQPVARHR